MLRTHTAVHSSLAMHTCASHLHACMGSKVLRLRQAGARAAAPACGAYAVSRQHSQAGSCCCCGCGAGAWKTLGALKTALLARSKALALGRPGGHEKHRSCNAQHARVSRKEEDVRAYQHE